MGPLSVKAKPIQQFAPPPPTKSPSKPTPYKISPKTFSTPTRAGRILRPMINLAALHRVRKHPVFAAYFDAVHPLFWLVLIWQLRRAFDRIDAYGSDDALIAVSWWGSVEITYYGDPAPSPSAYRPIAPTRKAWDDPCRATALPTLHNTDDTHHFIFPCFSGGSGRAQSALTKGACAFTPNADTS